MRYAAIIGFLAAIGVRCAQLPASPAAGPAEERTLTIIVHDYAGLPDATLRELEKTTTAVLRRTGAQVDWVVCTGRQVRSRPALCDAKLESGRAVLRIVDRHPGKPAGEGDPLGSAEVKEGYVTLFAAEIRRAAAEYRLPVSSVMAYAAVHEIGHLLLGPEHSRRGIMTAVWDKGDYRRMIQRSLVFSNAEAARMRQAVQTPGDSSIASARR